MRFLFCGLLGLAVAATLHADPAKHYEQLCATCHGADLRGGKGGDLLGALRHGDPPDALARSIRDGFPGLGMPAFTQLTDGDIRALVVFLQERRRNRIVPGPAAPLDPQRVWRTEHHTFRVEPIVTEGLHVPWSVDWLPDGRLLVTERNGRLRVIENGRLLPEPIADIPPVIERGEGGLMAVAVHPAYTNTGWVYLSFSDPGEGKRAMTKIVRGRIRDHRFVDQETIFALPREQYQEGHVLFGSRLVFAGDYLFFSVGERGVPTDAQRLDVPNGKIHRVFHDGSIPPDNPFASQPGAWGSIWAYGVRNPQGLALDPATGELWEAEHGPRGGDEVNFIQRGRNYGWPFITYGIAYDGTPVSDRTEAPGMEQPVRHWTPSIAVSQVAIYSGDRFPAWRGHLLVGSLAQQKLLRLEIQNGQVVHEEELLSHLGRIRDIKTAPDGHLYLVLEQLHGASGWVVRLVLDDA